jgi:hypothetical protein
MTTVDEWSPSNKNLTFAKTKKSLERSHRMAGRTLGFSLTDEGSLWTTQRVIDELHYHLECFKDRNFEEQAKHLLYRIPVYRPVPPFVLSKKDLTERLKKELSSYDEESRQDILKTAIGRIFENIDERYFIQSVKKLLRVELVD